MKHLSVILILTLIISFLWPISNYYIPYSIEETVIDIKYGSSAQQISNLLEARDIIKSRLLFNIFVRLSGTDHQLSYGRYIFKGKMSLADVVHELTSADVIPKLITIPEGLNLHQIAKLLAVHGFGNYDRFLQLSRDSLYASELVGMPVNSLEGFLFPETYFLPEEVTEDYILKLMVEEFKIRTSGIDFYRSKLGFYSTLILASIVEKEVRVKEEYPLVAGVYLNRLNDNHRLEADPTVAYLLINNEIIRPNITYEDLKIDSPYNTYKNTGLPPGPICNPGIAAIKAVLEPEITEYYFFFASYDGRHEFSRSYNEHLLKQNEIKRSNASR